jgi:RNA-binding protein YlmH
MTIYEHFHHEEHSFVDQVVDWKQQVIDTYTYKVTDFLDPREQEIVSLVIGKNDDLGLSFWGGSSHVERKKAMIFPSYIEPVEEDFRCKAFEMNYPSKFVKVGHRDVLGALMSIGVKREKFGDIIIKGETIQLVVDEKVTPFLKMNLTHIGKAKINLKEISSEMILLVEDEWNEKSATVSSFRVDALIAHIFNLSRQKVIPYIKSGTLKVNWKVVEQPSYECKEGDVISIRGLGRCKLISIEGKTKKEKWRLLYGIKK